MKIVFFSTMQDLTGGVNDVLAVTSSLSIIFICSFRVQKLFLLFFYLYPIL